MTGVARGLKTRLLGANYALCRKLNRRWRYPLAATFWDSYDTTAADLAERATPPRVVDIGAGRITPYAAGIVDGSTTLIGIDVLRDDLAANPALDERIVCDVSREEIPERARDAGLVTSRAVLEHIPDLDRFAREVHTTLAPGGATIHLFAARYSFFAILNRLLPDSTSRRLLFALRPESVHIGGFPTFYNNTHATGAESAFTQAGMIIVETKVSYQVSHYFHFFFPLFLLMRLWETLLHRLAFADLGSYVLLTARRPNVQTRP